MHQLPLETATVIEAGFTTYHTQFKSLTRRAKRYFERGQWERNQTNATERLDLYTKLVNRTVEDVFRLLEGDVREKFLWREIKRDFGRLIVHRGDKELAESFFNSIARRIFDTVGVNPDIEFIYEEILRHPQPAFNVSPVCQAYRLSSFESVAECIENILESRGLNTPYRFIDHNSAQIASQLTSQLPGMMRIDIVEDLFYRGRLAYLIGRVLHEEGINPLVITLTNSELGVEADAVLLTEDEMSIAFSFAHTYFHVETRQPAALISFLKSVLPKKPVSDLWNSIGYNRHGKTVLFRELQRHLHQSTDRFEVAPGIPGMVMLVFTMPSYEMVFKVIKDEFDYPKQSTRKDVMSRYHLVFHHDRGGRLLDAQWFEHLTFNRDRFDPKLLEKLLTEASESVQLEGNKVIFSYLYIERRVTPLNLYLGQATDEQQQQATIEYGQAIRDLAATNIFPGDLFLKNFGVTRHGRVLFYDYDELCFVTDCNFRKIPPAPSWEDELSDQPWYTVHDGDVFPEEFAHFLGLKPALKKVFFKHHRPLITADFWWEMQKLHESELQADIRPYPPQRRLGHKNS
ncbi:MAG: bifunctional isocitrate dehydrogenase kinase/phosphatase [Ardenticatenaceae bacterium]|nr:bifunctional isocitrate dehydrogenase kinase/phosphatase [Ardenticatenaceae bacterium]